MQVRLGHHSTAFTQDIDQLSRGSRQKGEDLILDDRANAEANVRESDATHEEHVGVGRAR
ncbi:MAG: hypothetical protein EA387_12860 [Nitriliruptor sp.]|nr:MAG: hypothetical protein EA387_12860 [Nitriliruptor sp.]